MKNNNYDNQEHNEKSESNSASYHYETNKNAGLRYRTELERLIDDPISDAIFNRVVNVFLSVGFAIYLLRNQFLPFAFVAGISALIVWIIGCLLQTRAYNIVELKGRDIELVEQAVKLRRYFEKMRVITIVCFVLFVILLVCGI